MLIKIAIKGTLHSGGQHTQFTSISFCRLLHMLLNVQLTNVCHAEKHTKRSLILLLFLVRFFVWQTILVTRPRLQLSTEKLPSGPNQWKSYILPYKKETTLGLYWNNFGCGKKGSTLTFYCYAVPKGKNVYHGSCLQLRALYIHLFEHCTFFYKLTILLFWRLWQSMMSLKGSKKWLG